MPNGYAQFRWEGHQYAHRYSYANHKGRIPKGRVVMHKCDVRHCVRPSHLKAGTTLDNNHDMHAKGRGYTGEHGGEHGGEKNGNARITKRTANKICREYKRGSVRQIDLARRHGISRTQIGRIVRGEHWA